MTNKSALEIALGMVLASDHPEKALVAEKLQKQIASIEKKKSSPSRRRPPRQLPMRVWVKSSWTSSAMTPTAWLL
jgi:hypothetical protein